MTSRTAFVVACALALGGCASYAPGIRDRGSYVGRYDTAPGYGYGYDDDYDSRYGLRYRDDYPGYGWGFGSFGYGYGYGYGYGSIGFDPWYGWNHPYGGWGYHPWPGHHRHPPPGGYIASGIHPIQVPMRVARQAVGAPVRNEDPDGPRSGMRGGDNERPAQGPRNDAREPHRERPRR